MDTGERRYLVLDLSIGLLKLGEASPGDWCVILNRPGVTAQVLGRYPDQRAATYAAERYALLHGNCGLMRRGARWRDNRCSRKTRVWARAHGITLPLGCTAGEAKDHIVVHQAIYGFR